jgi:hypothetical protein
VAGADADADGLADAEGDAGVDAEAPADAEADAPGLALDNAEAEGAALLGAPEGCADALGGTLPGTGENPLDVPPHATSVATTRAMAKAAGRHRRDTVQTPRRGARV